MAKYEIPLKPNSQSFAIALAGVTYNLTLIWNSILVSWVLDIADVNKNPILQGIPLVTGTDLLAPFSYLNFGGTLTCSTDNNADAIPTYNDLGSTSHLIFTTP